MIRNDYDGCKGRATQRESFECAETGFRLGSLFDRQFVLSKNNKIVTARVQPTLELVSISENGDHVVYDAPGMRTLSLPLTAPSGKQSVVPCRVFDDDIHAIDVGDDAANWFCQYLNGDGFRLLVYKPLASTRYLNRSVHHWQDKAVEGDKVAFADHAGYHLATVESFAAINARLEKPIILGHFRPNIVITGTPAFAEDEWRDVQIGDVTFRIVDKCTRCIETTVDPIKGEKDPKGQPLNMLLKTRKCPLRKLSTFGVLATMDNPGVVKVGDTVYAL